MQHLSQELTAILSGCLPNPSSLTKFVMSCAAGIQKRVGGHASYHSFVTHPLENGCGIRTIQELLGHKGVETTMIHIHVLNRGCLGVRSLMDT